jgi:DNA modification methylase
MNNYNDFLASKQLATDIGGITKIKPINPKLFEFQKAIVEWALKRGRACLWEDCGLGKTFQQLEWARQIPGNVLILTPLAVAQQTIIEAEKLGIQANYTRSQAGVEPGITVTNYEMLSHFDSSKFQGVVLDESSILKHFAGKMRTQIIETFAGTPYRLACTATPAPNDYMEIGNHAEFVGAMSRSEMLSMFFVHDGGSTQKWRLKRHAESKFWEWVCSWAVMIRKPSDLGFQDEGFILPPFSLNEVVVESHRSGNGEYLFEMEAQGLQERIRARRDSINERVIECAEMVREIGGTWVIWCNLNSEADALEQSIRGAEQVAGSESVDVKVDKLIRFASGRIKVLVTKPSIAGHGMNWQHCHNIAFVGLSDSWEQYYQAVRRCWRFGQKDKVNIYIITAKSEGAVVANIKRKERDAAAMVDNMIKHMHTINAENIKATTRKRDTKIDASIEKGRNWELYHGDCVAHARQMEAESIDFSIFSPPFASLYTYSADERDMGNSKDDGEFAKHFEYIIAELGRVIKPGRLVAIHCFDIPSMKERDGIIGLKDFSNQIRQSFDGQGFIYHSRVTIWKDPVTQMQRTKALGLLHKQIRKDSSMCRQGLPDYLIVMRKLGENGAPISHTHENFPVDQWQQWASPIWMDINPSETLQYRSARSEADERHIAPLQLEVIRRAVVLWSNPDDLVYSPFAGIGSEGVVSIRSGRRFVGSELKDSYFKQAVGNLQAAETESKQLL